VNGAETSYVATMYLPIEAVSRNHSNRKDSNRPKAMCSYCRRNEVSRVSELLSRVLDLIWRP